MAGICGHGTGGAVKRVAILAVVAMAGMVAFLAVMSLEYRVRQGRIYALAGRDPAMAAKRLLETFPPDGAACAAETVSRDGAALLTALEAVEGFATSPAERTAEAAVVLSAGFLRFEPPDLSYGPLQIRPSSVLLATNASPPITTLLDRCAARATARQVIERKLDRSLGFGASLTRSEVLAIAALHNGQRHAERDAEQKLANRVYREIVYHLFQELRFFVQPRQSVSGL